jgi:prepilin-type N-terminal cleavage/methylation domain-containing protein
MRRLPSPQCRLVARRAFSLMELLIVISMIGILAAVAVPVFVPDAADHLQAAGEQVASDLAYARSLAVANNSRYRLTFDPEKNVYYLSHSGANAALNVLPAGAMGSPSDPKDQRIVKLDLLPTLGTRVSLWRSPSQNGGQTLVEFGPYGETTATQEAVIWLTAGAGPMQRFLAVRVNPVTGLATLDAVRSQSPG